jgi:hypothetical protein
MYCCFGLVIGGAMFLFGAAAFLAAFAGLADLAVRFRAAGLRAALAALFLAFLAIVHSPYEQNLGTMELWNYGTLELWNFGTMELWNFETMEL